MYFPGTAIFQEEGKMGASKTARQFAYQVIKASLEAALADPEYTKGLIPYFLIDIGKNLHDVQVQVAETKAAVLAAEGAAQARDAKTAEELKQIRAMISGNCPSTSSASASGAARELTTTSPPASWSAMAVESRVT